jgi:uncharacterized protein (TIGR03067 family)
MKSLISASVVVLVSAWAVADDKADKGAAFDAAKLVGNWDYVAGTKSGEKVEKDHLVGKVTITKDTITIPAGQDMKFVIAYKLNTKASPVGVDMDIKDGPVKEGKAEGIIELKGDDLKLCYVPMPGGKRPTKFESTKDNGAFYFVLKRSK